MNLFQEPFAVIFTPRRALPSLGLTIAALFSNGALAQTAEVTLPAVTVKETPSVPERNQLPGTTESVTARQLADTVNMITTEDALKYMPGLIVRRRNIGDQFAPLATRTSGLGQSARSLVFADGVLLSTLIGNNNSNSTPRWAMVNPEEIERIDVMYGPYSAAYAGNSMGAVVEMTTRMPDKFEGSINGVAASQNFSLYGTNNSFNTTQLNAAVGSREGALAWRLSADMLDTQTQSLNIITVAQPATTSALGTPVTGAILDRNRLGAPIYVIGAGGMEKKEQMNLKAKFALDINAQWQATYTFGMFQNDVDSRVDTYLRDANGQPVYAGADLNIGGYRFTGANAIGAGSFSSTSGRYTWQQQHYSNSATLKSNTRGEWDWEAVVSLFKYGNDQQRIPGTALPAADNTGAGTIVSLNGTGWQTLDLKGFWRPVGFDGPHQVSFGLHRDTYNMENTTYATGYWQGGDASATNAISTGKSNTNAVWLQDAWRFAPGYKLTLGGRQENWRAYNGLNYSLAPASFVNQPTLTSSKFSPKISLGWEASRDWQITGSYGSAYRFPTVSELYQAVTVAGVVQTPNPNLRPEFAKSGELAFERIVEKSRLRISLFQESLTDALISQNSTIPGTTVIGASTQNINRIRSRGFEIAGQVTDAFVRGLDLSGSYTYVNSRILSDPNFLNAANVPTDVTGKFTPNIPKAKASGYANYHLDEHWSGTVGARYSARVWTTLDNTDINPGTYQGFEKFFVVDTRVNYQFDPKTRAALGIDNLNNKKYYLFHPFPQRTIVAELRHTF
jgi:iron complex outermembrane receptor protein